MNVSARGYRAYRTGPISQSQRTDMVLLAHIRDQFALGLQVGPRRVGRLMRQNAIFVIRTRKHKLLGHPKDALPANGSQRIVITSLILRQICWIVILLPIILIKNGLSAMPASPVSWQVVDISYIWTREGWLYLAAVLDLHSRRIIGPLSGILRKSPVGQWVRSVIG